MSPQPNSSFQPQAHQRLGFFSFATPPLINPSPATLNIRDRPAFTSNRRIVLPLRPIATLTLACTPRQISARSR